MHKTHFSCFTRLWRTLHSLVWVAEGCIQWKMSEGRPRVQSVAFYERHHHTTWRTLWIGAGMWSEDIGRVWWLRLIATRQCTLHRVTDNYFLERSPGFHDAGRFVLFCLGSMLMYKYYGVEEPCMLLSELMPNSIRQGKCFSYEDGVCCNM